MAGLQQTIGQACFPATQHQPIHRRRDALQRQRFAQAGARQQGVPPVLMVERQRIEQAQRQGTQRLLGKALGLRMRVGLGLLQQSVHYGKVHGTRAHQLGLQRRQSIDDPIHPVVDALMQLLQEGRGCQLPLSARQRPPAHQTVPGTEHTGARVIATRNTPT